MAKQAELRRSIRRKQCEHGKRIVIPECDDCLTHRRHFDNYHFNYCEWFGKLHESVAVVFMYAFCIW